ncbi:MAG: 4Fe-4S binding protein [Dorea sp.]|nr:4Fe-4S binding protein [Dorea sp.]
MAVKKRFPYRAALAACQGQCGAKETTCSYGCMGCGKCETACKFGAISITGGTALVDEEKCIGCGKCVGECPQRIIRIHECAGYIVVKCSNRDKGKEALVCPTSCIGCGMCERVCTAEAVKVIDNLAVIDETRCLGCGMCAVKCPRHAIIDVRGILTS